MTQEEAIIVPVLCVYWMGKKYKADLSGLQAGT